MLKSTLTASLLAASTLSAVAHAGLVGSGCSASYYAYGYSYGQFASGAVNGGSLGMFYDYFSFIVTDTQIICDYSTWTGDPSSWSDSDISYDADGLFVRNGFIAEFAGVEITGVAIDSSTVMPGFDQSMITFNGSAIAIDWTALAYDNSTRLVLNVNSIPAVPAPGAVALLGAVGLVGSRRRRD